eukprot:TRINITY_DN7540_c0_g1_i3.p1 TRINITY_DN7540_c0_g1~~TRINITY_DN7540_c0_g1_i3.p1  ORF type:complete len:343 (-),score=80.06 TRINITY_DN7540_c0_g1_i3:397-1389(-)
MDSEEKKLPFIRQLFENETRFAKQMEILVDKLIVPLRRSVVKEGYVALVFACIELIREISSDFADSLRRYDLVGKSLSEVSKFFVVFEVYSKSYENGILELDKMRSSNQEVRKAMEVAEECGNVSITTLLNDPINHLKSMVPLLRTLSEHVDVFTKFDINNTLKLLEKFMNVGEAEDTRTKSLIMSVALNWSKPSVFAPMAETASNTKAPLNTHSVWNRPARPPYELSVELLSRIHKLIVSFKAVITRFGVRALPCISLSQDFEEFHRMVCEFQKVDLNALQEDEKLPFWVNCYNMILLHGYLKFKKPTNGIQKIKFFKNTAYKIGDNTF